MPNIKLSSVLTPSECHCTQFYPFVPKRKTPAPLVSSIACRNPMQTHGGLVQAKWHVYPKWHIEDAATCDHRVAVMMVFMNMEAMFDFGATVWTIPPIRKIKLTIIFKVTEICGLRCVRMNVLQKSQPQSASAGLQHALETTKFWMRIYHNSLWTEWNSGA